MRLVQVFPVSAALWLLAACEVTVTPAGADSQANDVQQVSNQVEELPPVAAPPIDEFNAEAEARAQQAALGAGTEQERAQSLKLAQEEFQNLRVEVDISDRELRVLRGDTVIATHDVAVGTNKWPTPTGSWQFHRVDLNPEWNPPKDEEWAKDEEKQAPGAADNPLGRARLVYRMPNTVHGTTDLNSLGKASSHGSIRVANEVALKLAQTLLKAGGSWHGDKWFTQMSDSSTEEYQIRLQQRIPIEVRE